MNFFRRLFGRADPVSSSQSDQAGDDGEQWPSYFKTKANADRFIEIVRRYFSRHDASMDVSHTGVVARDSARQVSYGLMNLGQHCMTLPPAEWEAAVAEHFDRMADRTRNQEALDQHVSDYSWVRERLALRLWPDDTEELVKLRAVSRPVADGLLGVLCIDLPDSARIVAEDDLAAWNVQVPSLFDQAIENVIRLSKPSVSEVASKGGSRLLLLDGESIYTASLGMTLARFPELIGKHGAFVAVPTRQILLAVPFNVATDFHMLHSMMFMAHGMHAAGPGSVTARVYWVTDNQWNDIPYSIENENLQVRPPASLVDMLDRLA